MNNNKRKVKKEKLNNIRKLNFKNEKKQYKILLFNNVQSIYKLKLLQLELKSLNIEFEFVKRLREKILIFINGR